MNHIDQRILDIKDELFKIRKDLHLIPELGFKEYKTAAYVAEYMIKLDLEVQTAIGGTGVIALLKGNNDGPTIALRACLDALAMEDCSDTEYETDHIGTFHGCGHDGNMTMVLGAAIILSSYKNQIKGNVKFIFQPSEEETGGAAAMIEAGGLKKPDVEAIFHVHNWHGISENVLVVKSGPVLASSDTFELIIIGKPGHGAWPHLAVDPIVVVADVISALQNIVSREIDPMKPALITIGKIYGGTAVNIIPEKVTIVGTVRTFDPIVRDFIQSRIEEIALGVTQGARASYQLRYNRSMPPVNNDQKLTSKVSKILNSSFGPGVVTEDYSPEMGCEEFSLFQEQVPGLFLFLGKDKQGQEIVPIHAPNYRFNDETLTVGVKALCEIVLNYKD